MSKDSSLHLSPVEAGGLSNANLFDFFNERVVRAGEDQHVELSRWTVTYLSHLLVRLSKTGELFREDAPDTLAELHLRANTASREEAVRMYRYLGDRALTVAGYFSESLRRKPVGVAYYADMGEAAYARVVGLSERGPLRVSRDDPWLAVFRELAHRFRDCLELLSAVAERDQAEGTRDLVRLYEIWLSNRSPHAAKRLASLGVIAPPGHTPEG